MWLGQMWEMWRPLAVVLGIAGVSVCPPVAAVETRAEGAAKNKYFLNVRF